MALKIERAYTKDKILELYLNEIYLGLGAYGVAAAALTYFDKGVNELTIPEAAYLAALPKAPNNYQPFRHTRRAIERRNWVLDQMADDGFIKRADAEKAKKQPLGVVSKSVGPHYFSAEYFAEEVRRELFDRYGEKKLYEGGLSVRTTLDPKLQVHGARDPYARTGGLRRAACRLARADRDHRRQDRRLGRQSRQGEIARRHQALADGGGAGRGRQVGAHRPAARARAERGAQQGARHRHPAARRHEMGQDQGPRAAQGRGRA